MIALEHVTCATVRESIASKHAIVGCGTKSTLVHTVCCNTHTHTHTHTHTDTYTDTHTDTHTYTHARTHTHTHTHTHTTRY
jgi:hypothetical protein